MKWDLGFKNNLSKFSRRKFDAIIIEISDRKPQFTFCFFNAFSVPVNFTHFKLDFAKQKANSLGKLFNIVVFFFERDTMVDS